VPEIPEAKKYSTTLEDKWRANAYGRRGALRCIECRKRHMKVFANFDTFLLTTVYLRNGRASL